MIGRTQLPLVYAGEALFHIGRTGRAEHVEARLESIGSEVNKLLPEIAEEPSII